MFNRREALRQSIAALFGAAAAATPAVAEVLKTEELPKTLVPLDTHVEVAGFDPQKFYDSVHGEPHVVETSPRPHYDFSDLLGLKHVLSRPPWLYGCWRLLLDNDDVCIQDPKGRVLFGVGKVEINQRLNPFSVADRAVSWGIWPSALSIGIRFRAIAFEPYALRGLKEYECLTTLGDRPEELDRGIRLLHIQTVNMYGEDWPLLTMELDGRITTPETSATETKPPFGIVQKLGALRHEDRLIKDVTFAHVEGKGVEADFTYYSQKEIDDAEAYLSSLVGARTGRWSSRQPELWLPDAGRHGYWLGGPESRRATFGQWSRALPAATSGGGDAGEDRGKAADHPAS